MAAIFSFRCTQCGAVHEGAPSIAFPSPAPWEEQTPEVRAAGHLGSDLCHYRDGDGGHFFARCILEVPIHGSAEPFLWGVWASLSEANYRHYEANFTAPDETGCWFGWFCNYLPGYPSTYALKTRVHPRGGGLRPWLELERGDHPLCIDHHEGIDIARAQALAERALHP